MSILAKEENSQSKSRKKQKGENSQSKRGRKQKENKEKLGIVSFQKHVGFSARQLIIICLFLFVVCLFCFLLRARMHILTLGQGLW